MSSSRALCRLAALAVLVAGCGMTAAQNDMATGNETPGVTPPSQGSFANACAQQIGNCRWAVASCTGDPACAHWYDCVQRCDAAALVVCHQSCNGKYQENAQRAAAEKCLFPIPGQETCVNESGGKGSGGAGGTAGDDQLDAGTLPAEYGGSGAIGGGTAGIGALDTPDAAPPIEAGVEECYSCFNQNCAGLCANAGQDESSCAGYIKAIKECLSTAGGPSGLEACLLLKGNADAAFEKGYKTFVDSAAMKCVYGSCSQQCFSAPLNKCLQCERSKCPDELDAVLSDADALSYVWCRRSCVDSNEAGCATGCDSTYVDGAVIAEGLFGCRASSCVDSCG
jgi:hypothetical protein